MGPALTLIAALLSTTPLLSAAQPSGASLVWPELGLVLCAMGIIVAVVRKKRLRVMLGLAILFAACLWLGLSFSS